MSTKNTKPELSASMQKALDLATETATAQVPTGTENTTGEARVSIETRLTAAGKTKTTANAATVSLATASGEIDAAPACCCLNKEGCCCTPATTAKKS